ncbi:malto-oligosyltrehalose trehalohydrolase [Pseudomonas sp. nanlin1]|uniref:malto-oligosyltrehalose trehalohydrolase n=1 Tax=Pseudomonas sp. nanlin1 TaxID=3040605 RepID=UPI00388D75E7
MPSRISETWSHGAVVLESGSTRFALWAPDATQVSVEIGSDGDARQSLPMQAQADGWFVVESQCPPGTAYRYKIDAKLEVPDPASRAQQSDVHSPSLVVDPHSYTWQNTEWQGRPWHETVIYELHVGALGGFAGVESHLARLADLGITAIELMPIAEFPGDRNWGYDGVLPYAPEASYGTPDQLKHMIDCAHGHGISVILDVVYNHFGPDGNYLGAYAKEFFRHDKTTPWGDAIDFRRQEVRDYFIDNTLMWLLEYRFDGLRFDAVHAIESPNFLQDLAKRVRSEVAPGRHVFLTVENEHNDAGLLEEGYDAQWNDDGHNALHVLLTGEDEAYYQDYAEQTTEKVARFLGEGFVYQGQVNTFGEKRGQPSGHLPPSAFVLFLQNHDQIGNRAFGERLSQLCSDDALRAATAVLLLSPMTPMLFMGDEFKAADPFLFFTSHHGELAEAVRNGRRAEFKAFAAFADPERRAKIPDPNAKSTFTDSIPDFSAMQREPGATWQALYKQLLGLRARELGPRLPGSQALGAEVIGPRALTARWCLGDGSELRLDLNLGDTAVTPKAPLPAPEHLLFASRSEPSADAKGLGPQLARVSLIPADQGASA